MPDLLWEIKHQSFLIPLFGNVIKKVLIGAFFANRIFLISPELFHQLARADIVYADLCTMDWGSGNRTISYLHDDNGSVVEKMTESTMPQETLEVVTYAE